MAKNKVGRPTVMTEAVIGKLEAAFLLGCTDREACFAAEINTDTLYEYQKKYPEFTVRKELLRENPVHVARRSVLSDMEHDGALALKYLERKKKKEFSLRSEVGVDQESVENIIKALEMRDQPRIDR